MNKYETLRHYFGHEDFRSGQEPLVDALLSGRDVLGVMPTGAGKSMCYQVPALMQPGIALVISPLISLMKDQVAALKAAGVAGAYLNSSLTPRQLELATQRACQGAYKIIYVAPERLEAPSFRRFAKTAPISLVAVDEAHCVSQWGQDFRPNYLRIADFIDSLPHRPAVGAFTATATQRVREDIVRLLGLQNPTCITTGFDRENLFFEVIKPQKRDQALQSILREKRNQCGIIYCATRKTVEELTDKLRASGLRVTRYHAGLSDEERRNNQEDFQYDRVNVMVATNAFGMGIDKSNVRFVIHYNMPKSIEAYYQEAGRAGRDGSPSECILLYNGSDIYTARWMLAHSEPNPDLTPEEQKQVQTQDYRRLQAMIDYCGDPGCYRRRLLHYFGETAPERCTGCSDCMGLRHPRALGQGNWEGSIVTGGTGIDPRKVFTRQPLPTLSDADEEIDDSLLGRLKAARTSLATKYRVAPYIICADVTLEDMLLRKPRSLDEMLQVKGMGTAKVGKYGQTFLKVLQGEAVADTRPRAIREGKRQEPPVNGGTMWTAEEEDQLRREFAKEQSIREIASAHGRSRGAIRSRLRHMGLIDPEEE